MVCGFGGASVDRHGKWKMSCKCGKYSNKTTKAKAYKWLEEHSPWGPFMELNRRAFSDPK